jgi:ubiquinone/menaquinone biosynthesis C-methylase UbiE
VSGYIGTELEVFEAAHNWKQYVFSLVEEHIGGRVLEVGAGIGGTTRQLARARHREWLCLEPDPRLAGQIRKACASGALPQSVRVQAGTTADLDPNSEFDAVLYMDVLEHVENDGEELARVCRRLAPGGALIVLGPAMPWLYSAFDAAIGHFRRYTRASLSAAVPGNLRQVCLKYLDSVGVLLSFGNRALLRNAYPTQRQIQLWDRRIVPLSRRIDPALRFTIGKSILGVWRRPGLTE